MLVPFFVNACINVTGKISSKYLQLLFNKLISEYIDGSFLSIYSYRSRKDTGLCYMLLYKRLNIQPNNVRGVMSCLGCVCFLAHGGVKHILCCVYALFFFVFSSFPVSLDCSYVIAPVVFSSVYLI